MSRLHHHLKTETKFFQAVENGLKRFEIRENDRDFKLYDIVYLEETVNGVETGRKIGPLEITYILTDEEVGQYGLCQGHCIFAWNNAPSLR